MNIEIKLFGQLKDCFAGPLVQLELTPGPVSVNDLKQTLLQKAVDEDRARGLLAVSALATDQNVLRDEDLISTAGSYLLLPPVCGG